MNAERPAIRWWFPAAVMALGGTILIVAAFFSPSPDDVGGWLIGGILLLAAYTSGRHRYRQRLRQ